MEQSNKLNKLQMTSGPILKNIVIFAVPLMLTNLLQVFYSVSDTVVVSLSSEQDAVGAIGTTTAMINLIVNIFIGCSVGARVAMAQCLGAKNKTAAENTIHTAMLLSIIFGIICSVVGIVVTEPILKAMGNRGRLLTLAITYAKIYFFGVPFISATNFATAIINANGDTKTPLYIMIFSGFLNVSLNLLFVLVFNMSVDGMAIATTLSNAVSAIFLIAYLMRNKGMCQLKIKKLRLEKKALLRILHIGVPAGIQSALFSLSHMVIQSSIVTVNNMIASPDSAFQPVVKGSAAGTSIESFGFTGVNSIAQAAISFTGQNMGAEQYKRIEKVRNSCYSIVFVMTTLFAVLMLCMRRPLLSLYGVHIGIQGSLEQIAYDAAVTRMFCMFIPYFLLGFMEVGSGIMQGMGYSFTSTAVSLTGSVVFRILWIMTVFRIFPKLEIIFISYPVSWLLTSITQYICTRIVLKRKQKETRQRIS